MIWFYLKIPKLKSNMISNNIIKTMQKFKQINKNQSKLKLKLKPLKKKKKNQKKNKII